MHPVLDPRRCFPDLAGDFIYDVIIDLVRLFLAGVLTPLSPPPRFGVELVAAWSDAAWCRGSAW